MVHNFIKCYVLFKTKTLSSFSQQQNREDVQKKFKNLNPNKSPGPDKLHSRILNELYSVLDKPLAILFQKTLKKGKLPDEWKHAIVTAISKKGDKRKPNNCRPVSLTCIICKTIESMDKNY